MGSDGEIEKPERKKNLALAPIATPLAGKKLCKRTFKLVRRAAENKSLRRGVKEVVKSIRKGQKGLCVLAGNVSPIDVITHIPVMCEEADIPYLFVHSREELANAASTKRPTSCVLVQTQPIKAVLSAEDQEKMNSEYSQVVSYISDLTASLF